MPPPCTFGIARPPNPRESPPDRARPRRAIRRGAHWRAACPTAWPGPRGRTTRRHLGPAESGSKPPTLEATKPRAGARLGWLGRFAGRPSPGGSAGGLRKRLQDAGRRAPALAGARGVTETWRPSSFGQRWSPEPKLPAGIGSHSTTTAGRHRLLSKYLVDSSEKCASAWPFA